MPRPLVLRRCDCGGQTTKKPPLAGRLSKEERKLLGDNPGGDYRLSCWFVALYINRFCGLNGDEYLVCPTVFTDYLGYNFILYFNCFRRLFCFAPSRSCLLYSKHDAKTAKLRLAGQITLSGRAKSRKAYHFYTSSQMALSCF